MGDDDKTQFDGVLLGLAQQHQGIDDILDTFFGFLGRKTDFFTSPDAEKAVLKALNAAKRKYNRAREESAPAPAKPAPAAKAAPAPAPAPAAKPAPAPAPTPAPAATTTTAPPAAAEPAEGEEKEDPADAGKQKPNSGNGGSTDKYTWTQTLQEVELRVPLPSEAKLTKKGVVANITNTRLTVGIKGQPPVIDGELHARIKADDAEWTMENNTLSIQLHKLKDMEWWSRVIVGDQEINTKKVAPENSKLSDLDGETRGVVEKMMFDQQRKQAGLPTSDEMKKQEMMQKFMAQHPEMDFSKTKFS